MPTMPNVDQIEVSLLGPGYGECAVIHLGNNKWVVIDSCIDVNEKQPATLSYFQSIGVDPSTAVKLIIVTHWHDDHIRGMGDLVKACPSANICMSSVFTDSEFLATVLPFEENNMLAGSSGIVELKKVLAIAQKNSESSKPVIRAFTDRAVLIIDAKDSGHGHECSVYTLTPSDKQYELFLNEIAKLNPSIRATKYRIPANTPNHASVVTWIAIGDQFILLGADLEETSDPQTGWTAVTSSLIPRGDKAIIFKVPHHGSVTAHNDDVWKLMLDEEMYAIMTPFNRGKKKLPSNGDIARIKSYTGNAYCTAAIANTKTKTKRPSTVEKTVREVVGDVRASQKNIGHIRMRNKGASNPLDWHAELMRGAHKL